MNRIALAGLAAIGLLAAGAAPVHGQTAVAEAGFHRLWVGDTDLSEFVIPFGASWSLSSFQFDVSSAWATAAYEAEDGAISRLSGLTDVTARVMVPVLNDRARIILASTLPTGTETLRSSQLPVAAILTTDLLALPVRSFGSGAGLATGVAVARPWGEWVVGGIGVYRVGAGFEPVAAGPNSQVTEFRPGSEIRLRLALERPKVSGTTIRLASSWSRFSADETEEEAVFSRGDRFMGEAVAEMPFRSGSAMVYAWNLYRSESEVLVGTDLESVPSSNLLGVGASATYPLNRALSLLPRLELTVQRGERGYGGGNGWIARVGSGVNYRLGGLRVEPALLVQAGALNGENIFGLVLRGGVLWQR